MSQHSRLRCIACLLAVLTVAGACTTQQPPQRQGSRGTPPSTGAWRPQVRLTVDVAREPRTLNPLAGYAPHGAAKFYDGLVEHRADGVLEPRLAAALPQPDAAGTTWTVRLRPGVRFSDGSTFGTEDVLATYRALLDPAFESPLRSRFAGLRRVDAARGGRVRFHLAAPDPEFARKLVLGILPASALDRPAPAGRLAVARRPVGTGPFRLTGWRHGRELTMRARDGYFRARPPVDAVTVRFRPDEAARLADVRSGAADAAQVPNAVREPGVDGAQIVTSTSAGYRAVTLSGDDPFTADPLVRKALNYAVDRSALVRDALGGVGQPASTPFTEALPEFADPATDYPYDPAAAGTLLDRAGWRVGGDGLRRRGGVPARVTLRYPEGDGAARSLAGAFAAAMRGVGVQVIPRPGATAADAALVAAGDPFEPGTLPGGGTLRGTRAARADDDPAQRAVAFRAADRAYFGAPSMVVLARMQHTYAVSDAWRGYRTVLDPPRPGMTWGLFADLTAWTRS